MEADATMDVPLTIKYHIIMVVNGQEKNALHHR
jgi:hypothetical protein